MQDSTVQQREGLWLAVMRGFKLTRGERLILTNIPPTARYVVVMGLSRSGKAFDWHIVGTEVSRSTNTLSLKKSQVIVESEFLSVEQGWRQMTDMGSIPGHIDRATATPGKLDAERGEHDNT